MVTPDGDTGGFDRVEQGEVEGGAIEVPAVAEGVAEEVVVCSCTVTSPRRAVAMAGYRDGGTEELFECELAQEWIDGGSQAFADGATAAIGLLDEHGVDAESRQLEGGACSGGSAAEDYDGRVVRVVIEHFGCRIDLV